MAATGGSTNAVLHLLAIAREAGVALDLDDFDAISRRTPLIADLKPGGRYTVVDLFRAGGTPLVARRLLEAGLLRGDVVTVDGTLGGSVAARGRNAWPAGRAPRRPTRSRRPAASSSSRATSRRTAAW